MIPLIVACSLFSAKGAQRSGWIKKNGHSLLNPSVFLRGWSCYLMVCRVLLSPSQEDAPDTQIFLKRAIGPLDEHQNWWPMFKTPNSHIGELWPTFHWLMIEYAWLLIVLMKLLFSIPNKKKGGGVVGRLPGKEILYKRKKNPNFWNCSYKELK